MTKRAAGLVALALGACSGEQGGSPGNLAGGAPAATNASAALPDYLADYPGSTRVEVPNLGAPGTDSRSGNAIAMETDDTPIMVAEHYRARFAAAGVPVRADTAGPDGGLIGVGRDGERGAMLTISRIGSRTRIAIIRRRGA